VAKFTVTIEWRKTRELRLYANDKDEAKEKVLEMVSTWSGVKFPEVVEVTED
jgi:hypothetical protein